MGTPKSSKGLDDLLTLKEAALWLRVPLGWLERRARILPGIIIESNKVKRFYPRGYLNARLKGKI